MSETSHSEQSSTKEKETKMCTASLSNLKSVSPKGRCLQFSHKCLLCLAESSSAVIVEKKCHLTLVVSKIILIPLNIKTSKDKEAKKRCEIEL